jgi:hypothetical protein
MKNVANNFSPGVNFDSEKKTSQTSHDSAIKDMRDNIIEEKKKLVIPIERGMKDEQQIRFEGEADLRVFRRIATRIRVRVR